MLFNLLESMKSHFFCKRKSVCLLLKEKVGRNNIVLRSVRWDIGVTLDRRIVSTLFNIAWAWNVLGQHKQPKITSKATAF